MHDAAVAADENYCINRTDYNVQGVYDYDVKTPVFPKNIIPHALMLG